MQPLRAITTNFEHRGHRVLLMTLLLLIVVSPFVQQYRGVRWLLAVSVALVLLAAVRTVANQARQYHIALVLGVLALVFQFGILMMHLGWLETVRYVAMMSFLFWVCGLLLRDITLTTLGYGDITPLTPYATTASFTEAVFGQLYLAILVARLVARLVGLYIVRRGEPGQNN